MNKIRTVKIQMAQVTEIQGENMTTTLEEDCDGHALRAWSKVMETIRRVGAYRTVIFDDSLIHVVIWEMGGWQTMCAMLIKDQPFKAREFEKRYTRYSSRPPKAYPRQLIGITDSVNIRQGYPASRPILVGNEQQALQVLQNGQEAKQLLSFKPLSVEQYSPYLLTQKTPKEKL